MKRQWSFSTSRFLALGCLGVVLAALPGFAQQQNSGGINGTVKDTGGSVLAGASVAAVVQATGVLTTTQTNNVGQYSLPNLPVGLVNLKISNPGFKTSTIDNIRMVAGQTLTFDVNLAVGAVNENVSVSAEAERVDTTNSDMGTTMSTEQLTALPVVMGGNPRAALSFLTTLSSINTQPGSGGISAGGNQAANFATSSIQGSNPFGGDQNNVSYTIDGVNAAYRLFTTVADFSSLPPDAIQEFRLASNFNAEQGWDNGVGVAFVTKSGTNQFHGAAWWYGQNTALDAKSYLSARVAPDHQNEWGGMFGGPIRRDKTFFFATLDFFRFSHVATGLVASVPTAQMLTGDFSQVLGSQIGTDALGRPVYAREIYDPTTTRTLPNGTVVRDPYMCKGGLNVICPSQFSSISQYLAGGYPAPTQPGIQNNWIGNQVPSPLSIDKFSFKIDHQFGTKYQLMGMLDAAPYYSQLSGTNNWGSILTVSQSGPAFQYRPRAAFTGTLRPNLLFNINFSASYVGSRLSTTGASATSGQAAGLTGVYTPNLPMVSIANTTGFGLKYLGYSNPQYVLPAIGGFVAWVEGAHALKFGSDYIRSSIADYYLTAFTAGQYNFSALSTSLPGFGGQTGWGFASFLTGNVASATLSTPENLHHVGKGFSLYVQDQWRATSKLTVNYGLRWSASIGPAEDHNSYGAFDPTVPNPAAGNILGALTFWGSGPGHNGHANLIAANYNLWEPRLGLAYAITPTLVVRSYYGLINTPTFSSLNQGTNASFYGQFAQTSVASTDGGLTPYFNWQTNGYPPAFKPVVPNFNPSLLNGSAVQEMDYHHNQAGRTQSFGLSIEKALPWGMTGTAEYIGKLTHGLQLTKAFFQVPPYNLPGFPGNQLDTKYLSLGNLLLANINSPAARAAGIPVPYPGFNGTVAQALLPYPQYAYVAEATNTGGFSLYHGAHFSIQKRFGGGLSFLLDSTISKQLASGFFQANQYDTRKALSPIDIPWVLTASYAYDLPFGLGKRYLNGGGVVEQLVGGWNIAGINTYQGGTVISVTTEAKVPGITYLEPLRVPGQSFGNGVSCSNYVPGKPSAYLNINAFATPAAYTLGNIAVVPNFRGCGYSTENISLTKAFRVTESKQLKFSANFFNAFNRHTWTGLGTDINNTAAFGKFTGVTAPRSIQLAGKFVF